MNVGNLKMPTKAGTLSGSFASVNMFMNYLEIQEALLPPQICCMVKVTGPWGGGTASRMA